MDDVQHALIGHAFSAAAPLLAVEEATAVAMIPGTELYVALAMPPSGHVPVGGWHVVGARLSDGRPLTLGLLENEKTAGLLREQRLGVLAEVHAEAPGGQLLDATAWGATAGEAHAALEQGLSTHWPGPEALTAGARGPVAGTPGAPARLDWRAPGFAGCVVGLPGHDEQWSIGLLEALALHDRAPARALAGWASTWSGERDPALPGDWAKAIWPSLHSGGRG